MYLTDEDLTPTETIISELLALRAVAPGNEAHQAEHAEAHGTLNEELAEIDNDARVAGLLVPNVTLPREVTFPQAISNRFRSSRTEAPLSAPLLAPRGIHQEGCPLALRYSLLSTAAKGPTYTLSRSCLCTL